MNKAGAWLDKAGVDCAFRDDKTAGIEREMRMTSAIAPRALQITPSKS